MDSRMRRVLQSLAKHDSPTMALDLFPPHDAPSPVVSGQLNKARKLGLCDKLTLKSKINMWQINEKGREELAKP